MRGHDGAEHSAVKFVETNDRGNFVIDNLSWGEYGLAARKEDDFFPDVTFAFYGFGETVQAMTYVTLTQIAPHADVVIRVFKAAVLKGSIVDRKTGKLVLSPGFLLRRAADPNLWLSKSVSSQFRVLVPARVPFTIEVSAPGYKTLHYSLNGKAALVLDPGKELELKIYLQPK